MRSNAILLLPTVSKPTTFQEVWLGICQALVVKSTKEEPANRKKPLAVWLTSDREVSLEGTETLGAPQILSRTDEDVEEEKTASASSCERPVEGAAIPLSIAHSTSNSG